MSSGTTYRFNLIRNPRKEISWITLLLVLMNVLALILMGYNYPEKRWIYWLISLAIFVFLAFQYRNKPVNTPFKLGLPLFILMGTPWAATSFWWLLPIAMGMGLLERMVHNPHQVIVDETGIQLKRWPDKNWSWKEIEFAVLKDGILTWALYNEKTIQVEVEIDKNYSENSINAFITSMKA